MKMKYLLKSGIATVLLLASSLGKVQAQQAPEATHTPVNGSTSGKHEFSINNLSISQTGAFYSYLWWFSDNDFQFVSNPRHTHFKKNGVSTYNILAITTENYGTGGPPPLADTVTATTNNGSPATVLPQGNSIYLQHYRNAVRNDTMYLILTYANKNSQTPINGTLTLDLDPQVQLMRPFINDHPKFHPNQEQLSTSQPVWNFNNLMFNEERSILIPVKVDPNAEQKIRIKANLQNTDMEIQPEVKGQNMYSISAKVENSHDPNMMSEDSDSITLCTTRGDTIDYTVNFQNVGEAPTRYVKVTCFFDDKVDLNSISNIQYPTVYDASHIESSPLRGYNVTDNDKWVISEVDLANKSITFEMNKLILRSTNDTTCRDLETTRSKISFKLNVKSNYIFGDPVVAHSKIVFDDNDPILTNTVESSCMDPLPMDNGGGFQDTEPIKTNEYPIWWYVVGGVAVVLLLIIGAKVMRRKK